MAHLGVHQAVHRPAAQQAAPADAGAHGEVDEAVEAAGRAPARLAQRGRVHVRVERHGTPRSLVNPPTTSVRPAGLGGGRDVAPGRRSLVEVHRPERANADGREDADPRGSSRKNSTVADSVACGVVVGMRASATTSSGPDPTTQTNFVPPPSMPPKSGASDGGCMTCGSPSIRIDTTVTRRMARSHFGREADRLRVGAAGRFNFGPQEMLHP